MLDTLAKIYDESRPLVGVAYALLESNPQFITAVELRFDATSAVFRAVADDDTLLPSFGDPLAPEPNETVIDVGNSAPWLACAGLGVCWAWRLTNQQGYSDGVRLEFSEPGEESRATVELVVSASAIDVFVVTPNAVARQPVQH